MMEAAIAAVRWHPLEISVNCTNHIRKMSSYNALSLKHHLILNASCLSYISSYRTTNHGNCISIQQFCWCHDSQVGHIGQCIEKDYYQNCSNVCTWKISVWTAKQWNFHKDSLFCCCCNFSFVRNKINVLFQ